MQDRPHPGARDGDAAPAIPEQEPGVDWLLASQIELVTNLRMGATLTLMVGGLIISGELISGRRFLEETAAGIRRASVGGVTTDASNRILEMLARSQERWMNHYPAPLTPGEERAPMRASHIHLRGARVIAPGQTPVPERGGMLWRGKLSSIDGWTFGSFSTDEAAARGVESSGPGRREAV